MRLTRHFAQGHTEHTHTGRESLDVTGLLSNLSQRGITL